MDAISYQQYMQETDDWLKTARARLLAQLIARHRPRGRELELLEVGAGAGQNLPSLREFGPVDAVEVNPQGRDAIVACGIARDLFADPVPFELPRRYDVICALDVIEHLPDDRAAVQWMADHLRPDGLIVLTVPAYEWLFSDHDRALGHYRRYTRKQLVSVLPSSMQVLTAAYFTHFAFPFAVAARAVWSVRRMLSRRSTPSKQRSPRSGPVATLLGSLQAAELSLIDKGYHPPFGLSAYVAARIAKPATP